MPTDIHRSTIDSFTNTVFPSTNFSNSDYLALKGTTAQYVYIWFPLPYPSGATVETAVLKVYLKGAWAGGAHTVTARRITGTWAEDTITYTDSPAVSGTNSATAAVTGGADEQLLQFTVTNMVIDAVSGWFGIRLSLDTTTERRLFSAEGANQASFNTSPTLEVTYHLPPAAPSNLRPSGSRATSLTDPVLSWAYSSEEGQTQAQSQVQISTSTSFTSPAFDSGYVANEIPQYTADANLADNVVRYWRVRVKDVQGSESAWSATAIFERRTKGVLTITSPVADNNDVESVTPIFTHTFTARTQRLVQHTLFTRPSAAAPWVEIYSDGTYASTATAWELPRATLINSTTADYKYQLRVWDTFDRESLPGDSAYVEAARIFQYLPTAGVTPVSGLVGTAVDFGVDLDWTRATAPDYYVVFVDGVAATGYLDPVDLFVSGTSYSYTHPAPIPWQQHAYSVVAVVVTGGVKKSSTSNPSVNVTTRPIGIWLVAPDAGLSCVLLGQDVPSIAIGETAVTLFPENARVPIRISGTTRGYEGTVTGTVTLHNSITARTWLDKFEAIAALPPTANIRLVFGHRNFPIMMGSPQSSEFPSPDEAYAVTFSFWQTGDFTT